MNALYQQPILVHTSNIVGRRSISDVSSILTINRSRLNDTSHRHKLISMSSRYYMFIKNGITKVIFNARMSITFRYTRYIMYILN